MYDNGHCIIKHRSVHEYHCIMDDRCVMVERVGPVLANSGFGLAPPGYGWMERRWVQGFDARAIIPT